MFAIKIINELKKYQDEDFSGVGISRNITAKQGQEYELPLSLDQLAPETKLVEKLKNKEINKKKFKKMYLKYIEKKQQPLMAIIAATIEKQANIFFVCTEDDSEIGYLEYFKEYVENKFGISFVSNKTLKKLFGAKKKDRKKLLKKIQADTMTMSSDGKDAADKLKHDYAIDLAWIKISNNAEISGKELRKALETIKPKKLSKILKPLGIKKLDKCSKEQLKNLVVSIYEDKYGEVAVSEQQDIKK